MSSLQRSARRWLGLVFVACLAACATEPEREPGVAAYPDTLAVHLLRAGKPAEAAREYQRLAALAAPPERYVHGLHAAEAYIEARDLAAATGVLDGLVIPEDEPFFHPWRGVLFARLDLARDPKPLLARLERIDPGTVLPGFRGRYHEYRAAAYVRTGDYLGAAREYVALDPLLGGDARRGANALAIWEALNKLEVAYLSQHLPADRGALRGWMDLAIIARSPAQPGTPFDARLRDWALLYPAHPASRAILPKLAERRAAVDFNPQHVALLLPLSGEYGAASAAIRDGFLAAWYHDPGHYRRRVLTVYDANAQNAVAVYRRALEAGADFVVGPLDKPAIKELIRGKVITAPTLALNEVALPARPGDSAAAASPLYQFSLAPEEEARQVAERAWLEGRVRARVIAPRSVWGERVARAFEGHWQKLGGQIAARTDYRPNASDLENPVARLLAGAERRPAASATAVEAASGAEFIFMAANPRDARLIQPLIAYQEADPLPIYATSSVYSGTPSRQTDRDLDGLVFPDMPWVLESERSPVRAEIERYWPKARDNSTRLYAFGVDACALIADLGRLSQDPLARLEGATGLLHLEPGGLVRRQLSWAQFSGGAPVPVAY